VSGSQLSAPARIIIFTLFSFHISLHYAIISLTLFAAAMPFRHFSPFHFDAIEPLITP